MIGAQVVTYRTASAGSLDRKNISTLEYTDTTLYGSLQPMEVKEDVTNIDYTIERYRFITAPTAVAVASKATDQLIDSAGTTYRVFGAKVFPRINGSIDHVEIYLEVPAGLNG